MSTHTRPDEPADHGALVERLFREHYSAMVGVASLLLGDRGAAEETVQEAFSQLLGRGRPLSIPADGRGYLYRSVINGCRSRLRHLRVERRPQRLVTVAESMSPETHASRSADAAAIAEALQRLSRRQRECVVCHYRLDLSIDEVGTLLHISSGSVKTHLHRAIKSLNDVLEGYRDV